MKPREVLGRDGGRLDDRVQVRADERRHGELDEREDDRGDGHRRHGAADHRAREHAEREGEQRRSRSARSRARRTAPGCMRGAPTMPSASWPASCASLSGLAHHVSSRPRAPATTIAASADQRHLGHQPARAGDALVPDEPVRAGLELARHERRAPEHADDRRQRRASRSSRTCRRWTSRALGASSCRACSPAAGTPTASSTSASSTRGAEDDRGREAELPPGEPDHRTASSARGSAAVGRSM